MPRRTLRPLVVLILAVCTSTTALPQMPNPYGPPISLEHAKKVAAPAIAEALKNNLSVAVAIRRHLRQSGLLRENGQHTAGQRQRGHR